MANEWVPGQPRYIHITRWNEFQHYKDRDPKWIKVYTRITRDDNFLALTGNRRAILLGLWLEYAVSNAGLRHDTRMLSGRLALRVTVSDLEALNHAGFIHFAASSLVQNRTESASPEEETEREVETEQDLNQEPLSFLPPITSYEGQNGRTEENELEQITHQDIEAALKAHQ